jgi:hypothetical protein
MADGQAEVPVGIGGWIWKNKVMVGIVILLIFGWVFNRQTWKEEVSSKEKEIKTKIDENKDLQKQVQQHKNTIKKVYDEAGRLREIVEDTTDTASSTTAHSNTSTVIDDKEKEKNKVVTGKIPQILLYAGCRIGDPLKDILGVHYRVLGDLNLGLQGSGDLNTLFTLKPDLAVYGTLGQQF